MINKFLGDKFKLSYTISHTAGRSVAKATATIKGPDKEYTVPCAIKDDNTVELLVTKDMYTKAGMYDVVFDNEFGNGESATHLMQFSLKEHAKYKVEENEVKPEVSATITEEVIKPIGDMTVGNKTTTFSVRAEIISGLALAGVSEDYKNPLLTWIKLVFADDKPNANKQGIKQDEFKNLMSSMKFMPVKADYKSEEAGLGGHDGAVQIGVIAAGQQEGNTIVAVGALYNDEHTDVVDFFKKETSEGRPIDFSWEIRYKDSTVESEVEWLTGTTTKAITAVANPAYEGRAPLVSFCSFFFLSD